MSRDSGGQVFDVSKPQTTGPSATSRPVIVGHQPTMSDPMVKDEYDSKPSTPISVDYGQGPDNEASADSSPFFHDKENESPQALAEDSTPEHDDLDRALSSDLFTGAKDSPTPGSQFTPSTDFTADEDILPAPKTHEHTPPHTPTPLTLPTGEGVHHPASRLLFWLGLLLLFGMLAYALLDAGVVKTNIDLPFHFFKQETDEPQPVKAPQPAKSEPAAQSSVPAGFKKHNLTEAKLSFNYPTAWGEPELIPEVSPSVPAGSVESAAIYTYLVNFAQNKDVQLAITSSKYLPPKRTPPLYYDFLQWCVGSHDKKFYKESIKYMSINGVETPTVVTCDQGPLTDAKYLNPEGGEPETIVQLKSKSADGKEIGDLYTKNLTSAEFGEFAVFRVKDAAMSSGENIQKLLASIKPTTTSTPTD